MQKPSLAEKPLIWDPRSGEPVGEKSLERMGNVMLDVGKILHGLD